MGSTQGNTSGSFEFADYIEDVPQVGAESAERCGAAPAPAKAGVKEGHAVTDELHISGKVAIETPDVSSEDIQEPVKRLQPLKIPREKDRGVSLPSGIELENLVDSKRTDLTPPSSTIPVSFYGLRNRTQSKLVYDVKYHPMDDTIRPSQAAKRRSAHGEALTIDSDNLSDASTVLDTEASTGESSGAQSEGEEKMPKQRKKAKGRKQPKARPWPAEGTRRSTRKVPDQKTSYNMDIHPQDKYLVISSDDEDRQISNKKRVKLTHKRPNVDDDSESDNKVAKKSKTSRQKPSRRTGLGTCDSLDSSSASVLHSVETSEDTKHAIATTTSSHLSFVNSPPSHGIRRRENMDVWHYPPGKRYLNHDRDYWPDCPDQSFEVFQEKLEDQLAREAMEASPLNFEHDNKENMSNTRLEQETDDYSGISIIPSAQYLQSSDERQLADHRALVSEALYSDEPPQSYGLDGTHGDCVQKNDLKEYMDILASGGHLPSGPTYVETQAETQDSVLGSDSISEIRESDL